MEMEAIRGLLAKHPGPYRLRMADGSVIEVPAAEFIFLPSSSIRDARTIVIYGPDVRNFRLLDSLLVVSAEPVQDVPLSNGH